MTRLSSATGILVVAGLLLASSQAGAQTRTENLRWLHEDPTNTAGYKVFFGTSSRNYTQQKNVGVPPIVSTAYTASVQVPATGSIYFAVVAYDAQGNQSPFSNEIVRTVTGGSVPPPPSGALSAVTGFVLRDPRTQAVLDGAFTSGDRIDAAVQTCTTIEIVGNSYLSRLNQPGSVRKTIDGQGTSCNNAPLTHENNPPYALENENSCAQLLTVVGSHRLTATPYDGDNCSGAAGTPITVDFGVVNSSSGGSATTLGQPGQPMLVE